MNVLKFDMPMYPDQVCWSSSCLRNFDLVRWTKCGVSRHPQEKACKEWPEIWPPSKLIRFWSHTLMGMMGTQFHCIWYFNSIKKGIQYIYAHWKVSVERLITMNRTFSPHSTTLCYTNRSHSITSKVRQRGEKLKYRFRNPIIVT